MINNIHPDKHTTQYRYTMLMCNVAYWFACLNRHLSFMRHFFKYADRTNAKYVAQNTVQNCLKPTTPSRSTGVRTHVWCHSVGNQMAEVMKPNRNM